MAERMTDMPPALAAAANAVSRPSLRIIFYYVAMFGTVGVLQPYLPTLLEARGLGATEIGIVMAVLTWTRVVVNPVAAHVADVTGRRKRLALIATTGACIGFAWLTGAYGFWGVLAALAFASACQGPVLPVGENLCLLTIRARGLEYGQLRAWGSVAFIAVSMAAGFWLETSPKDHIAWMLVLGWLVILASVACLPDLRAPASEDRARGFRAMPAFALLKDGRFRLLLAASAANMSAHAVLTGFSTIHWLKAGISESQIGYLWSIGVVAEIALFWASAPIVRRLGPGWLLALGAAGGVIRWTGLGLTTDFWAILALQSLHGLTFGAAHLGAMTYLQRHVPAEISASGQALYSALGMGVAMALMLPVAGWLYSEYEAGAYFAMAGLAGIGVVLAAMLARSLKPAR